MRLLVSGTTRTMNRLKDTFRHNLGHLLTPSSGHKMSSLLSSGLPWAADNGAFTGFDPAAFKCFLKKISGWPGCLFVACPDSVGDAKETLLLFEEWAGRVRRACSLPIAFVGQDGIEDMDVPWGEFQAWFIGGSTEWKLSKASVELSLEAKRKGKHVHMGRVNSLKRMRLAHDMLCDSIDGSSASMFGDTYIARYCRWLDSLCAQPSLFDTSPEG